MLQRKILKTGSNKINTNIKRRMLSSTMHSIIPQKQTKKSLLLQSTAIIFVTGLNDSNWQASLFSKCYMPPVNPSASWCKYICTLFDIQGSGLTPFICHNERCKTWTLTAHVEASCKLTPNPTQVRNHGNTSYITATCNTDHLEQCHYVNSSLTPAVN